jgi:anti-anti-sigma factor
VHVTIETTQHHITILHLHGDVDMKEVTSFRRVLQTAIRDAGLGVGVELKRVPFMDSSGIAVLIEGLKWSRERSIPFILTHLTPSVQMVMETPGSMTPGEAGRGLQASENSCSLHPFCTADGARLLAGGRFRCGPVGQSCGFSCGWMSGS